MTRYLVKVHHMSYSCVPEWMKPAEKDPFDYQLRKKEEVIEEFKYYNTVFDIQGAYKKYTAGDTRTEDNLDNRERVVSLLYLNDFFRQKSGST